MLKTIFDKLNLDDVKRFKEIISLENVTGTLTDLLDMIKKIPIN